jgi:hypothetical protein
MKEKVLSFSLAMLSLVLAACYMFEDSASKQVTIGGTVTITRNGIPWNSDNFPRYSYSIAARSAPPPEDRPIIYAYSGGSDWRGSASVYYQESGDDYRNGTYQWKLSVPADKLPGSVYFQVKCLMRDVESDLRVTKEFLIQDKNTVIDIGVINFDVVRLFGNLPITVNGGPPVDYASRKLNVFTLPKAGNINGLPANPSWSVYLGQDGDWFLNIARPDSEKSLEFQVELIEDGGYLRKTLNAGNPITVYDTDKEVVFPDYPSVDFEAFRLSGTIEAVLPGIGESSLYNIEFFREDAELAGDDYDGKYLLSDTYTERSASGLKTWKTTIPALELPHKLLYSLLFSKGDDVYRGRSYITITGDTDLSRIDLGVFNSKYLGKN